MLQVPLIFGGAARAAEIDSAAIATLPSSERLKRFILELLLG
jgi:hypothetical protein